MIFSGIIFMEYLLSKNIWMKVSEACDLTVTFQGQVNLLIDNKNSSARILLWKLEWISVMSFIPFVLDMNISILKIVELMRILRTDIKLIDDCTISKFAFSIPDYFIRWKLKAEIEIGAHTFECQLNCLEFKFFVKIQ